MAALPSAKGCTLKPVWVQSFTLLSNLCTRKDILSRADDRKAPKLLWVTLRETWAPSYQPQVPQKVSGWLSRGAHHPPVWHFRRGTQCGKLQMAIWQGVVCGAWESLVLVPSHSAPKQTNLMPPQTFYKSCTFNRACKKTKGLLLK